jgi:hypothetical protein
MVARGNLPITLVETEGALFIIDVDAIDFTPADVPNVAVVAKRARKMLRLVNSGFSFRSLTL